MYPPANLASLYQLGARQYWMAINDRLLTGHSPQTVRVVNAIFEKVFTPIETTFDLIIVSKDCNRLSYVQHLQSAINCPSLEDYLTELQKSNQVRPLLAPYSVKNEFELAVIEYCITTKQPFLCLILPAAFEEENIPKPVRDSISELNDLSHSNIIT